MPTEIAVENVAEALRLSIGLLIRRLRAAKSKGEISLPEHSALARLDYCGPMTAAALAKLEQISPQSMGATLETLESRALIARGPDPGDGRQIIISMTPRGLDVLKHGRSVRTEQIAQVLARSFTQAELEQLLAVAPLLERLAQGV